jgi:hypothetical protein
MKLKFCVGDKVVLLTDPHAGSAEVVSVTLAGKNNLLEVKWPSGVLERVHESELRHAE